MKEPRKKFSVDELLDLGDFVFKGENADLKKDFSAFLKSGVVFHKVIIKKVLPSTRKVRGKNEFEKGEFEIADEKFEADLRKLKKTLNSLKINFITSTDVTNSPAEIAEKVEEFILQSN